MDKLSDLLLRESTLSNSLVATVKLLRGAIAFTLIFLRIVRHVLQFMTSVQCFSIVECHSNLVAAQHITTVITVSVNLAASLCKVGLERVVRIFKLSDLGVLGK